ncbi:hypothetical protein [Nocardia altamirensis]|uniref:hypothetical protein n=1 Tax=Nocardia TaxID=1817 RepID=UPI00114CA7B2|nr:hypothetical protein [Nocardia altamirensis]
MNGHDRTRDRILIVAVFLSFATLLFLNPRVAASEDVPLTIALIVAAGIGLVALFRKVRGQ